MNALLVYPEFPNTFWSYKHALKFIRKKAAFPPLGLLTLGAMLPEEWSLRLVDLNVRNLTAKDLSWADCAFVSAMAVQRNSPGIFQRHIDFIQNSGVVTAMVGLLQAPSGTRLYNRLMQEGRILGSMSGDNADGTTNIIPKMDMAQLKRGYHHILQSIYRPRNYYRRVRTFLREYNQPKKTISMDFQRVLAIFRSSVRLGILGKERFQYWWLLVWTLMRFPQHFPLAITLAIYGYHYRKVSSSNRR